MEGSYNLFLVALSYIVATIASYTALDLAGRIRASTGVAATNWLIGGAFSMGMGIWSMHFIGMLAFRLPVDVGYDFSITLFSLLVGVLASALALKIINTGNLTNQRLGLGGVAMGAGICTMHYVGMAAMKMEPSANYNPTLFAASVFIAIIASIAALWLAFQLNPDKGHHRSPLWQRLGAAAVMGLAIAGMHYTGMAAAEFPPGMTVTHESEFSSLQLAGGVALASVFIMAATLMLSVYEANMASKTAQLAESLKIANEELLLLVMHDPLTKLPNRLLLEDRIQQTIVRAKRNHTEFAVLFIDLDRFKTINDTMGHHIGDKLIKHTAERLQDCVRGTDMVARVGGDEFMVVLADGVLLDKVNEIADRMLEVISTVFLIEGHEIRISLSIGISLYPQDGKEVHELIINADAAMYYAKDNGRNSYNFFEPSMGTVINKRSKIEKKLQLAVEQKLLSLAYQPKTDVTTGEIIGFEALARWEDPELGSISPNEFIPLSEEMGLILRLSEWVLMTACRQAKAWQDQGLPKIQLAVNISPHQLNQIGFAEIVHQALNESGLKPEYLELEITESTVMQNPERAQQVLTELHNLGIQLSIDDFGTGYSSLFQLKSFPIDRLKIDQSFTAGVTSNVQDAAIVKAVIALAHSLDLEVIAEGVETDEQLAFIRMLKGEQYQGYLCSKPLTAPKFAQFLQSYKPTTHQSQSCKTDAERYNAALPLAPKRRPISGNTKTKKKNYPFTKDKNRGPTELKRTKKN